MHNSKEFFEYLYKRVKKENVLLVLTADHGVQPIVEQLNKQGLDIAQRYIAQDFIQDINAMVKKKYGVADIIQNFKEPQFYLNQVKLGKL